MPLTGLLSPTVSRYSLPAIGGSVPTQKRPARASGCGQEQGRDRPRSREDNWLSATGNRCPAVSASGRPAPRPVCQPITAICKQRITGPRHDLLLTRLRLHRLAIWHRDARQRRAGSGGAGNAPIARFPRCIYPQNVHNALYRMPTMHYKGHTDNITL